MAKKNMAAAAAHKLFSTALFHGGSGGAPPAPALPARPSGVVIHRGAPPAARLAEAATAALVVDVEGGLLLSSRSGLFPYFMLVAVEAGSFLRGLILLLLYPAIIACVGVGVCDGDAAVKAMAFVAFCGLRASRFRAGRAVLPRWLLEDVGLEGLEAVRRRRPSAAGTTRSTVVVWASRMPRVMVEPFLKEYLSAPADAGAATDVVVAAREMKMAWGFYTGLMEEGCGGGGGEASTTSEVRKKVEDIDDVVGFSGGSMEFLRSPLSSLCKEVYVVSGEEKSKWRPLPRCEYPRPLVFHDGRLAFRPTPLNVVAMFTWLPLGAALAVARIAIALALPYRYATPLLAATGQSWRLGGAPPPPCPEGNGRGQLYVCNHRTLIDPVYVSIALDRPVRAVSYSLSRLSELISPIGRTVHLARDRAHDGAAMARLLAGGAHVVVCPEGTTCRESYLLRFSPLFAELSDDVVPVALAVETAMFHATTAGGWKCLDPLYYLANPRMCYTVEFLGRVDTKPAREGSAASTDVANRVQRLIATALGYECTMLTRKDKYLMLAGNDGVVRAKGPTCQ